MATAVGCVAVGVFWQPTRASSDIRAKGLFIACVFLKVGENGNFKTESYKKLMSI